MGTTGGAGTATAELLLATLAEAGVARLWFCSGSELVPLQEAAAVMRQHGRNCPEVVGVPHEHLAICAAMGESAVTGLPVAVVAHADLGPMNFGAELHTALRGGYPVMIIGGYPATAPEHRTAQAFWNQQRWDHGALLRQYTKWDYKLQAHEHIGTVTARGLQIALSEPSGPVFLSLPAEVLAAPTAVGDVDRVARLGVARHGSGPRSTVSEIAERVRRADAPLLITERIGKSPEAAALLQELAERHGVGCRTTRFRMSLPTEHDAQLGAPSLEEADVIIVVEHHVPWIPANEEPRSDAWVAAVGQDVLAAEIPLHEFGAHVRVVASPKEFLEALLAELARGGSESHGESDVLARQRATRLAARAGVIREERASRRQEALADSTLSHAAIGAAVDEFIRDDEILVDELGDTEGLVNRSIPGTLFHNGGSALGWASSAAVGIGLASGRQVVVTTGDGAHLFGSPGEALWLQRAIGVPVVTVVANNAGYRTGTSHVDALYPEGVVARTQDHRGGRFTPAPDHAAQARAAGAVGITVRTPDELRRALGEARRIVERDRTSVLIDVLIPDHVGRAPVPLEHSPDEKADQ